MASSEIDLWPIRIFLDPEKEKSFFLKGEIPKEEYEKQEKNFIEGFFDLMRIVARSVIFSDPTKKNFDEGDFLRILGKDKDFWKRQRIPFGIVDFSLLKEVIQKYFEKAKNKWKNVQWYSPFNSSIHNSLEKNKNDRNEFLFEFGCVISRALLKITSEKSSEFWSGKETRFEAMKNSEDDYLEVRASKEDLILILNLEDFDDLKKGITKTENNYQTTISLDILKERVSIIHPDSQMKSGYARLIHKNALQTIPVSKWEDENIKVEDYVLTMNIPVEVTISDSFVGCLFVPSKDFVLNH